MRFDSYHPAINFIFFTGMIIACLTFTHPVFLCIGWLCALIYSIALEGKRAMITDAVLSVLAVAYLFWYASYHHFGETNLKTNFIGNMITLESLAYGGVIGIKATTALMWMVCVHAVISTDKVIYLLGRVSPRLALGLAILLRMVPRIRERSRKVEDARRCVGRGVRQGSLFRRLKSFFQELSIVITWTLEDFVGSSDSMRARGLELRGRTAFSIYRFDNRDRAFVIALFGGFTMLIMAVLLDQTRSLYAPAIHITPVTFRSYPFYLAYALTALLPLILQLAGETLYKRLNALRTEN